MACNRWLLRCGLLRLALSLATNPELYGYEEILVWLCPTDLMLLECSGSTSRCALSLQQGSRAPRTMRLSKTEMRRVVQQLQQDTGIAPLTFGINGI